MFIQYEEEKKLRFKQVLEWTSCRQPEHLTKASVFSGSLNGGGTWVFMKDYHLDFLFLKNVFSHTIHSNCIFLVLYFSPPLFPCPHPLLFYFLLEKNRPLRDINQKDKTSYVSLSTNPHLKGEWYNPEGAKGSQEQAKEPEVLPLPLLAVVGFFFNGGEDKGRALRVVSQYSTTLLHAQNPFYYDPVAWKELNSTLHQTSS